jgi:hypothetical protein
MSRNITMLGRFWGGGARKGTLLEAAGFAAMVAAGAAMSGALLPPNMSKTAAPVLGLVGSSGASISHMSSSRLPPVDAGAT